MIYEPQSFWPIKNCTKERMMRDECEKTVTSFLKKKRVEMGYTQKQLEQKTNIDRCVISEMETGKRAIGELMARRLGKFFKCHWRIFYYSLKPRKKNER